MRFSRPMTTSRLRRPMSASRHTTRAPSAASATPILAVAVVLPTPPLPEVMVTTFAGMVTPSSAAAVALPGLGHQMSVADQSHLRSHGAAPLGRDGDVTGDAQLCRRQVERRHGGGAVPAGPGVHHAAHSPPHQNVPAGDDLGPRVDVAQADDAPRKKSPRSSIVARRSARTYSHAPSGSVTSSPSRTPLIGNRPVIGPEVAGL